ncbi:hypothetical protein [Agrococcus jejuensis]|uniref:Uncharacterized protein n=1 Tax=Agrococcus jejuensis TaxID=399736 RepID=A0A1G8C3J9_9MICO|nr:hypothetical protein [Agrococcus jejuensis]SDH39868.1 hypothetical protein SAMN04489720_1150 [Agrococcus jejuensis]
MRFAWVDDVMLADGRAAATFAQEWFRDRATVAVGGETWLFRKEGFGGDWAAALDGVDRIHARSISMWRMRWEVSAPSGTYEVQRSGSFPQATFSLLADGVVVGDIRSTGFWTYKPEMHAPDAMPAVEAAFVLWVVRRAIGRASSAAAASAT